jgi:hypothetical protein
MQRIGQMLGQRPNQPTIQLTNQLRLMHPQARSE